MELSGVDVYGLSLNIGEQLSAAGTASPVMALNPALIFPLSAAEEWVKRAVGQPV